VIPHAIAEVITARRTNMRVDRERDVGDDLLTEFCRLATWAPNHKLTEPWRFIVVRGDARARVGEAAARFQQDMGERDEGRLDKTRGKYLRTPVLLIVACASSHDADANRRAEDRDAVAAAVQTLLLAATAAGVATYWGTGPVCHAPGVKELCGLQADNEILAAIYMGWPLAADVAIPARRNPIVSFLR
jgi:nitroreductase